MVGPLERQSSLFYLAFSQEASLIKDDLLEPIDALLDDGGLVKAVAGALGKRRPLSSQTGRHGIAPDRLLRLSVLKHIKGWSFRELEREVRSSLVYRRFCHFDSDAIPHFTSLSRQMAALGDDTVRAIHACIIDKARAEKVAAGNKLRTDTTVVESNIHHPTDSTLIQDGVRVLTRCLKRISSGCKTGVQKVRDRSRAVKHRVLEIHRAAKKLTEENRSRIKACYLKLLAIVGIVSRQAEEVITAVAKGSLKIQSDAFLSVHCALGQLRHFMPLVGNVVAQTRARILEGNTHYSGKLVSIFEPHTQIIRKGKVHKPAEFGRLVRFDEVENGIVSNFEVSNGNPADSEQWLPAIQGHKNIFGCAPKTATADRGYFSAKNEKGAKDLGVEKVALPGRGRLGPSRRQHQKQRWFRNALQFRAGIESRIATLKHRFGLHRAFYKEERGFKRFVGWGVIANNLVSITRAKKRKEQRRKQRHSLAQSASGARS